MQKKSKLNKTRILFYLTYIQDPYQVLPLNAKVDQGVMAIKKNFTFPKAAALLEPHHQIVQFHIQDTR